MWWFDRKISLPEQMIDLHNHVSPQIDDGASHDEDTLSMLQAFVSSGYTQIAITSHLGHPMFPHVTSALILERVEHVRQLAKTHDISLNIHSGAEIYYGESTLTELRERKLLPLGNSSYYLIEFPPRDLMSHMKEIAFRLTTQGIKPILAHPERYTVLHRKPNLFYDWQRAGWLMQLDVASLLGKDGRAPKKVALRWLQDHAFDLAASDVHRPPKSTNHLLAMLSRLQKLVGEAETDRLLVENPKRILADEYTLEANDRND